MGFKVVVAGASGGIGQPLSLLLKTCSLITELALYDIVNTPGVAKDISHISSPAKVTGHLLQDGGPAAAFQNADVIVIPAGIPRKPAMTRDDLFNVNAGIVRDLIEVIADVAPKAFILIISNPVNSIVPIAAEVLKSKKVFNARRLFGITTLDVVRAETFLCEILGGKNPRDFKIPVVGGHSGITIVPLFSQAEPSFSIPPEELRVLVRRVQYGGDEVIAAKDGAGSATLSMAYAAYRFTEALLKALNGEKGIIEPSYVHLADISGGDALAKKVGASFFSVPVELGTEGIEKIHDPLNNLTDNEQALLGAAVPELSVNIDTGIKFVRNTNQR